MSTRGIDWTCSKSRIIRRVCDNQLLAQLVLPTGRVNNVMSLPFLNGGTGVLNLIE